MTRANNAGLPQAAKSLSLMNQYIPLKDRQEAIKLAAQLERQERSNMLAATQMPPAVTPAAPAQTGKPVPIKPVDLPPSAIVQARSEEHTSELQSLMRIAYAVFCFKKKNK